MVKYKIPGRVRCCSSKIQKILIWNVFSNTDQSLGEAEFLSASSILLFSPCPCNAVALNRSGGAGRLPREAESADGWEGGETGGGEAEILDPGAQVPTNSSMFAGGSNPRSSKSFWCFDPREEEEESKSSFNFDELKRAMKKMKEELNLASKDKDLQVSIPEDMMSGSLQARKTVNRDHLHVRRTLWRPGFGL